MKQALLVLVGCALCAPAFAKDIWGIDRDQQRGGMVLSAMPEEDESDTDLWILCRKDGRLQIGAGANTGIGEGKGEPATLIFSAGGKTATLHGTSKQSDNFQMTGGTELVTTIARSDPLFAVLATGAPIRMDRTTFEPPGPRLAKFLAACPAGK